MRAGGRIDDVVYSTKYPNVFCVPQGKLVILDQRDMKPYSPGWYFWAEDEASVGGGPYDSDEEADREMRRYACEVLGSTGLPNETDTLPPEALNPELFSSVTPALTTRDKLLRIKAIGPQVAALLDEAKRLRAEVAEEVRFDGLGPITPDSPRRLLVKEDGGYCLVFSVRPSSDGKDFTVTYERVWEV